MSKKDKIRKLAIENGVQLIGDPIDDPDVNDGVFLFIKVSGDAKISAEKKISKLYRKLEFEGIPAKIVAPDRDGARIEALLKASLETAFPAVKVDLTVAAGEETAAIWISLPPKTEDSEKAKVEGATEAFLNQLGIGNAIVKFNDEKNYPSTTTCLRVLRRNAPCSAEELAKQLLLPGFDPMSLPEVKRFLDTARRKGQIVRRQDNRYILTLQCLMALGTSRDRFSPDISRALVLRRLGA